MIRCKLKEKTGLHLRKEPGKGLRIYKPGDIMEVKSIDELGGAADKFEVLDPVPEKDELKPSSPISFLKMDHRGGGRYNVINIKTGEAVNDEFLTKKEAQEMTEGENESPSLRRKDA